MTAEVAYLQNCRPGRVRDRRCRHRLA